MHSKRKLIISLSALAVTAVIAVVAVIAVLAASQQTLTSSINVQYIAKDVSATVSAKYYIMNLEEGDSRDEPKESGDFITDGGDNSITFDTESDYAVPPTLQPPVDTFNLESIYEYIYFEYKFTNNSSTSYIKLTPGFNRGADNSNMNETFYRGMAENGIPADWGDYQILGPNETMYATLSLSIQEAKDDANYSLNLTWNMTKATESDVISIKQQEFLANANIEDGKLVSYDGDLTEIYIPDSVTAIGDNVFTNKANITYVYIPESVTTIGEETGDESYSANYLFDGCNANLVIEIEGDNTWNRTYGYDDEWPCMAGGQTLTKQQLISWLKGELDKNGYYDYVNRNS